MLYQHKFVYQSDTANFITLLLRLFSTLRLMNIFLSYKRIYIIFTTSMKQERFVYKAFEFLLTSFFIFFYLLNFSQLKILHTDLCVLHIVDEKVLITLLHIAKLFSVYVCSTQMCGFNLFKTFYLVFLNFNSGYYYLVL